MGSALATLLAQVQRLLGIRARRTSRSQPVSWLMQLFRRASKAGLRKFYIRRNPTTMPTSMPPRCTSIMLLALLFFLAGQLPMAAQEPHLEEETTMWSTNGTVNCQVIDQEQDRLYIGGYFDYIGPPNKPSGAVLNNSTLRLNTLRFFPDGPVYAAVSDGNGGWFIGGQFEHIGPVASRNLAHIDQYGELLTAYNVDEAVRSMAIALEHGYLFVGGSFTSINDHPRFGLGILNIGPGAGTDPVSTWVFDTRLGFQPGGIVLSMAYRSNALYLAGDFDQLNFTIRNCVAKLDILPSGISINQQWTPKIINPPPAIDWMKIIIMDNWIYIGGDFNYFQETNGVVKQSKLVKIHHITGNFDGEWRFRFNGGTILSLAIGLCNGIETLFISSKGAMGILTPTSQQSFYYGLAMVRTDDSGTIGQWKPSFTSDNTFYTEQPMQMPYVYDMKYVPPTDTRPARLVLAGMFNTVSNQLAYRTCAYDLSQDLPVFDVGWRAHADGGDVRCLALDDTGEELFLGGSFTRIGGLPRVGLAALSLTTGQGILDWEANVFSAPDEGLVYLNHGGVTSMVLDAPTHRLYVGGGFNRITGRTVSNNTPIKNLIQISTVDAAPNYAWAPEAQDLVQAMCISPEGGTVYIAEHHRVLAVDNTGAVPSGWNAPPLVVPAWLKTLAFFNGHVYIGRASAQGAALRRMAPTGQLDMNWQPDISGNVFAIDLVEGNHAILAGGAFDLGTQYHNLCAFDLSSAAVAMPWLPHTDGAVHSVRYRDRSIYVGGAFDHIADTPSDGFARIHGCGDVEDLAPFAAQVNTMALADNLLCTADRPKAFRLRPPGLQLNLRLILGGCFDQPAGYMRNDLMSIIPMTEPFSAIGFTLLGGQSTTASLEVLHAVGPDAVVDWVLVELRDPTDPATVLYTQPAFVQRDGDVVDVEDCMPFSIKAPAGYYHIAVRHRNHLGIMSGNSILLSSEPMALDLTQPNTPVYGVDSRMELVGGSYGLWPGNSKPDSRVRYVGNTNDCDPILTRVGTTTNVVHGYWVEDNNLDGKVSYIGLNNDRDVVLQTIGGVIPTNVRVEQLP